jgi:hypothetical protein
VTLGFGPGQDFSQAVPNALIELKVRRAAALFTPPLQLARRYLQHITDHSFDNEAGCVGQRCSGA